jgi:indolepyruvate ferredoxin oxidoreductase beta subunit
VNNHEVEPIRTADERPYPKDAIRFLEDKGFAVTALKATEIAVGLGNHRAANTVMLGALAEHLDILDETWDKTLRDRIPGKLLELNRKAFAAGRQQGR